MRRRLVLLLVVYFAGFATAIYCLAPVVDQTAQLQEQEVTETENPGFVYSAFKSDRFAKSFNVGLHKSLDVAEDGLDWVTGFVKENKSQLARK